MKTYADTSFLFSLYATDSQSQKADVWRKSNPGPLPFTTFHRLELRNALGLAVFQKRITKLEADSAWLEVENDIAAGSLAVRGGLWHRVLADAELSALNHTPMIGCRTLDVLHVASAKLIGASEFCTFDIRQFKLAGSEGMIAVTPL